VVIIPPYKLMFIIIPLSLTIPKQIDYETY